MGGCCGLVDGVSGCERGAWQVTKWRDIPGLVEHGPRAVLLQADGTMVFCPHTAGGSWRTGTPGISSAVVFHGGDGAWGVTTIRYDGRFLMLKDTRDAARRRSPFVIFELDVEVERLRGRAAGKRSRCCRSEAQAPVQIRCACFESRRP